MAPTIVLLHGFTQTGASWDPVISALGESYSALAPDIRGHGAAADRRPVTLAAVLDDLRKLAPPRFTLAGYSMGGRLALHAALALPSRIERLFLIGASPGIADRFERAARKKADARLAAEIERLPAQSFAARWAQTPVLSGQPPAVAAHAHQDRLRNDPRRLARALRGLGTGTLPSLWTRLGELEIPVTLIVGERDAKFVQLAREMLELLPNAALELVKGAGHAAHLEAPDDVAALLLTGGAPAGV